MLRFLSVSALLLACLTITGCDSSRAASTASSHTPVHTEPCKLGKGTCLLVEANDRMHVQMDVEWTGDVDVDFLQTMIPHHQGAVDMARAVIAHGKDPQVKALAEAIVVAQEQEIAQMRQRIAELNAAEGGPQPPALKKPSSKEHAHH